MPHSDHVNTAIKTALGSTISNALLSLVKWTAGIFGNSFAIIADAIESTADIVASALVWLGLKYSKRPADENHPYGHGRIEPLVTFIVVAFLVVSATIIAMQSFQNIGTEHAAPKPWTLIVLGFIIVWKEISFQIIIRKSRQTQSTILKAEAWHHRSDSITSIAAFLGIVIALLGGKGFETADDWAALLAAIFLFYNSYKIFRPALAEIMDEQKYDELILKIREFAVQTNGVVNTEKCFVRKVGVKFHIDLHARVSGKISVSEGHEIAHRLKDDLRRKLPQLGHVLIHIEPDE